MAIAFGNGSSLYESGGPGNHDVSFNLTAAGLLVAEVYTLVDFTPVMTWDGASMGAQLAIVDLGGGSQKLRRFALYSTNTGTHIVRAAFGGDDPNTVGIAVYNYTGVDSGTPYDGVVTDQNFSDDPSITITSATNDVGLMSMSSTSSIAGWSIVNGTTRLNLPGSNFGGIVVADRAGAASIQINGTFSSTDGWGTIGANLNLGGGGGGGMLSNAIRSVPNIGLPLIGGHISRSL